MPSPEHGVVGILAGGGSLPREVAEYLTARGDRVHVVTITDVADAGLARFPLTKVDLGQVGRMVRALRAAGCKRVVIVGSIKRPDLATLIPDLGFILNLPAILRLVAAGGDDSLLTRVVRFFEEKGFEVVAPVDLAPGLLAGEGPLGRVTATQAQGADAALGFEAVRAMGPYDVGQAVVVSDGKLEAIEGVEGTDRMLERVTGARAQGNAQAARRGVLVKRQKPGQEVRIDLPAIGPSTVENAIKAGLAGIAVQAGGVLAAERAELVRRADADGIFVEGWRIEAQHQAFPASSRDDWRATALGARTLDPKHDADAAKGAGLLLALAPYGGARCTIVDRGHVLAVGRSESAQALIAGARGIHQWGRRRWSRRSGVAVCADPSDLQPDLVRAAAATGLAALAFLGHPSGAAQHAAIAEADQLGLPVVTLIEAGKGQHGRQ